MIINLYDPVTLEWVDVISLYESVLWNTTYNTPDGQFQINCDISLFDRLKTGYIVENSEDREHLAIIKSIKTMKSNIKTSLEVKGIMLEQELLSRRIGKGVYTFFNVTPTYIINALLSNNLVDCVESSRRTPILGEVIFPSDSDIPDIEETNYSSKYPLLSNEVYTLCQQINLGIKARFNADKSAVDLVFYVGNDKTFGTEDPVILAREFGTVTDCNYSRDTSQNCNSLLVIGEDNMTVHYERDKKDDKEPLIEKSLDVSSESPWPRFKVEKEDEEGQESGRYFRYIKFTNPEYVTNCDTWEKYNVDKVVTTEERTRTIKKDNGKILPYEEFKSYPDYIWSTYDMDIIFGMLASGTVSKEGLLAHTVKNQPDPDFENAYNEKLIGLLYDRPATPTALIDEPMPAIPEGSQALPQSKAKVAKKTSTKNTKKKIDIWSNSGTKKAKKSGKNPKAVVSTKKKEGNKITPGIIIYDLVEENYTVEHVTYETRDLVDYIYVPQGYPPSEASVIIQGSPSGGDVIYYENFEEIKVESHVYRDVLSKLCLKYLNSFVDSEVVEVELYHMSNKQYARDYDIGDIVTARDKEIGFVTDLRITSVSQTWDSKGHTIDVTLGTSVPRLTERIKLISKGGA